MNGVPFILCTQIDISIKFLYPIKFYPALLLEIPLFEIATYLYIASGVKFLANRVSIIVKVS